MREGSSVDKAKLLEKRTTVKTPCFVYVCAILVCMSSLNLGYDIGIIATAIIYIEEDLNITNHQQIEIMVSTANFFAIFGAIVSGQLAHRFGRRTVIIASSIISCVAVLLMATTSSFIVIVISRALNGISIGFSLVVTPLYIAEIAPARIRGAVVTYGEVVINVGHCAGYAMAYLFWIYDVPVGLSWRIMIGSGSIISAFLFVAMMFMPESPRWLSQHGFDEEAKHVLMSVSGTDEIEAILFDMAETNHILESKMGWKHIILPCIFKPDIALKKALIIALPIAIFQQLCAIEVWVYYMPKILQENGLSRQFVFLGTIFVGVSKLFVLLVAQCLMDRWGRKALLLMSSVLMCIFIGALAVIVQFEDDIPHATIYMITALVLVVGAFSLGWGPIPWLLNSELFALNVRSKAAGYATLLNRLTAAFTTLTFFTLQSALSQHGVYYLYFALTVGIVIFVYLKVPETKGKTLEQITKMLIAS